MRKTLIPLVASLALCGAGTAALIATNARAQNTAPVRHPMMLALAANGAETTGAAHSEGGMPPMPGMRHPMMGAMAGEFCKNIYAHQAGALAFLEAKLSLTPAQVPLFDRWKSVKLDAAHKRQETCAARMKEFGNRAARTRPSPVERMAKEEDRLKARLADVGAERPALAAVYASLSDSQKAELERGGMMMRHRMMGRMMGGSGLMHGGMMHGMGPHGMGGMPPMGPPPGGPADQPPPPPPQ